MTAQPTSHMGMLHLTPATPPSLARINIKASKTGPFRKGVIICVGRTNNDLCPVAALAAYTTIRGADNGPFFMFETEHL